MTRVFKQFLVHVLVLLLMCSGTVPPTLAQSAASSNGKALVALESKFFEHTYPSDSDEDRIARLEKLIFGETKTGDVQSRLADIQKIVSTNDIPDGTGQSASSSGSGSSAGSGQSNTTSAGQNTASSNSSSGSASNGTASTPVGSYPRVDAMEELLLGQQYKTMGLEQRLAQLEKKAFGHPTSSDDLSARTDAIEQYWQKNLSASLNQKYDRSLTQMESQVLGQSYPDKPIIERLQTLEGVVFPNEPPDTHSSIKEQLDTLANAIQISQKQGRKPMASSADSPPTASSGYSGSAYPPVGQGGYSGAGYAPGQDQATSTVNNAPGQYGSYGQSNPYTTGQSGNYGTQSGYANTDHPYPGEPAANSYTPQGQYTTTTAQPPPSNIGQITPFTNSPTNNESYGGSSNSQGEQKQGHPLLKGLAKALGAAAAIGAAGIGTGMMMNSMSPYGMGGYGYSPYGMGGMGGYGYSPYGMGGMGGMGGYGYSPYGMGGMGGMGGLGGLGGIRW
jgi:hypothetical protein